MELPELLLLVLQQACSAVDDYATGSPRPAAESLAEIANKIMKELPEIKLPPKE